MTTVELSWVELSWVELSCACWLHRESHSRKYSFFCPERCKQDYLFRCAALSTSKEQCEWCDSAGSLPCGWGFFLSFYFGKRQGSNTGIYMCSGAEPWRQLAIQGLELLNRTTANQLAINPLDHCLWKTLCELGLSRRGPTASGSRGGAKRQRSIRTVVGNRPSQGDKTTTQHTQTGKDLRQVPRCKVDYSLPCVFLSNTQSLVNKLDELAPWPWRVSSNTTMWTSHPSPRPGPRISLMNALSSLATESVTGAAWAARAAVLLSMLKTLFPHRPRM